MSKSNFELPEPSGKYVVLSYPAPGILLVRLNRPKDLNCINQDGHAELDEIWKWLDDEPTLNVGIITGTGRAFCAGADLKGKQDNTSLGSISIATNSTTKNGTQ
jgi:enoyl-CoA hydratase/carnithine racemase